MKIEQFLKQYGLFILIAVLVAINVFFFFFDFESNYTLIADFFSMFTPDKVKAYVRGFGVWGPLIIILLYIIESIIAPMPGQVLAIVTGSMYGPWWGCVIGVIGMTIGSLFPFYIGRIFGRPVVEKLVDKKQLEKVDTFFKEKKGIFTFAAIRILPIASFDIISYSAGLTDIKPLHYVWISFIASIPKVLLYTSLGDLLLNGYKHTWTILVLLTISGAITFGLSIWFFNKWRAKKQDMKNDELE